MNELRRSQDISGPHTIICLSNGSDTVYLFGEDHRNIGQCEPERKAVDVVDVIKACAVEGAHVYVEMKVGFKSDIDFDQLKCVSSRAGPRTGVLNHLRTCLYIMKTRNPCLSINFCDPRECFGPRSYSEDEDAFIMSMMKRPKASLLRDRFVLPLLKSDRYLLPELHPHARSLWFSRVQNPRSRILCAIRRGSVELAASLYRQAFDDVMNICALSQLEGIISLRKEESSGQEADLVSRTHIMYFGSAHIMVLCQFLQNYGFSVEYSDIERPDRSCVRMQA